MTVYMVRSSYNTIRGLWTNVDKMIEWVLAQKYSCTGSTAATDLDACMNDNQVTRFQTNEDSIGERVEWSEFFPTE
jgi:hypothetical protein